MQRLIPLFLVILISMTISLWVYSKNSNFIPFTINYNDEVEIRNLLMGREYFDEIQTITISFLQGVYFHAISAVMHDNQIIFFAKNSNDVLVFFEEEKKIQQVEINKNVIKFRDVTRFDSQSFLGLTSNDIVRIDIKGRKIKITQYLGTKTLTEAVMQKIYPYGEALILREASKEGLLIYTEDYIEKHKEVDLKAFPREIVNISTCGNNEEAVLLSKEDKDLILSSMKTNAGETYIKDIALIPNARYLSDIDCLAQQSKTKIIILFQEQDDIKIMKLTFKRDKEVNIKKTSDWKFFSSLLPS